MALDSNDIAATATLSGGADASAPAVGDRKPKVDFRGAAARASAATGQWLAQSLLGRIIGKNLRRRILLANVLGLAGLLFAMLYLSLHHGWLLDAKVDVVKTVSRITAEAIAYRAVNERAIFDPNRIPEKTLARAQRDDAFAALELPIDPHQAAIILKKLVGPANLKARIYSAKGTLILNGETLFSNDDPSADPPVEAADEPAPRLKNFWTRLHYWVINKELKVYRELGTANGFLYPEVQRAAQNGVETPILLLNRHGQQIVSMAEPIKRGNKILGVLLLSTNPGDIDDVLWDERWLILQIAAMALLVAIGSSLVLERTVAGPMRRLSEAANRVSQNISAREQLPDLTGRRDEVGQTGRAFVAMTNALYRRIEASEKFAADVAHELKNPLAAARSTAEALAYARSDADRTELVQEIQSELKRLNRLINDISSASRLDAELARQEMQPVDIRTVLESVNSLFSEMLADDTRNIRLIVEPGTAAAYMVRGNDGRLGQIFTNLIDNALSFSPEGGTVTVRAKPDGRKVEISVEDEGPGIPPNKLAQIFDRFYSDRPQTDAKRGKNSGLGLSISREIVVSHNGEIFAENRAANTGQVPKGARFTVRLPLSLIGPGLAWRI
ncbi:stimulus-sensing domain-containing protein [Hyphomicrobium sp.]|uniref:stimulus-sensing domain-containing protein n=1 Tax=Hyphomicrobium sp. TaxID=82 RepID=UPI000F92F031|nr:stimulus-sensing domain-containing protein [Hyphomicrobium sp.]MBN9247543.1 stimulus-sensing domain-containing protein [Hyphomicrobium sp.]RUP09338.1 MAG: HAMP domain-containing protein [Hyphomicrobium sp.]